MSDDGALLSALPDPRVLADASAAPEPMRTWHALARESLDGRTSAGSAACDATLRRSLDEWLQRDPSVVDGAIERAPDPFVARHLWRLVDELWRSAPSPDALVLTPFAIPIVVVTGITAPGIREAALPGVLPDPQAVVDIMRRGEALRGNATFTLSAALVAASALAIPAWRSWQRLRAIDAAASGHEDARFEPAPLRVIAASESAHLRFLIGTAMAATGVDLLAERSVARWGGAVTAELVGQLAHEQVSVLALPRAPQPPLPARHEGVVAQREVSAQLFASNAIRRLRAASGEPSAVISAHRAQDAPGGGELRLSLSSPLEARDAEGFRCPIFPTEPVTVPLRMLLDLLRDCRVGDVRIAGGVHAATIGGGAMPLFFRPDAIPDRARLQ